MLEQTWAIATQGYPASSSGDADPMWPACLACAVVDRQRDRSGAKREGTCVSCFDKYCWSEESEGGGKSGAGRIASASSKLGPLGSVLAMVFTALVML